MDSSYIDMDEHYVGDEDITGGLECVVPCKSFSYIKQRDVSCVGLSKVLDIAFHFRKALPSWPSLVHLQDHCHLLHLNLPLKLVDGILSFSLEIINYDIFALVMQLK